jgi:hypothetical protein
MLKSVITGLINSHFKITKMGLQTDSLSSTILIGLLALLLIVGVVMLFRKFGRDISKTLSDSAMNDFQGWALFIISLAYIVEGYMAAQTPHLVGEPPMPGMLRFSAHETISFAGLFFLLLYLGYQRRMMSNLKEIWAVPKQIGLKLLASFLYFLGFVIIFAMSTGIPIWNFVTIAQGYKQLYYAQWLFIEWFLPWADLSAEYAGESRRLGRVFNLYNEIYTGVWAGLGTGVIHTAIMIVSFILTIIDMVSNAILGPNNNPYDGNTMLGVVRYLVKNAGNYPLSSDVDRVAKDIYDKYSSLTSTQQADFSLKFTELKSKLTNASSTDLPGVRKEIGDVFRKSPSKGVGYPQFVIKK